MMLLRCLEMMSVKRLSMMLGMMLMMMLRKVIVRSKLNLTLSTLMM